MDSVKEILHQHKLRVTPARITILNTIINSDQPLSESEIKKKIQMLDRVTFYRSIKSLLDTKVIQGIITHGKVIKYSFCYNKENEETSIRFYCTECQRMTDLGVNTPTPVIPEGYREEMCRITITGVCKACNKSDEK